MYIYEDTSLSFSFFRSFVLSLFLPFSLSLFSSLGIIQHTKVCLPLLKLSLDNNSVKTAYCDNAHFL